MAFGAPDHHIPLERLITDLNTKIDLLNTNIDIMNNNLGILCGHTFYKHDVQVDVLPGATEALLEVAGIGRITGFYMVFRGADIKCKQESRLAIILDAGTKYLDYPKILFGNPGAGLSVNFGNWGSLNTATGVYYIYYNIPIQYTVFAKIDYRNNSATVTANIDYVFIYDKYVL